MAIRKRQKAVVRLHQAMMHTTRYACKGQAKLAEDVGCAYSTIQRLCLGKIANPTFELIDRITQLLSKDLGYCVRHDDLFSFDGNFPTASICEAVGCAGCLPDCAYDSDGNLIAAYQGIRPGAWSTVPGLPYSFRAVPVRKEVAC